MSAMPGIKEAWEEGCFGVTFERKYYHRGGAFIKRTLRPKEFRTGYQGLHIPRFRKESIRNEAESLRYIRRHTDIPVPTVYCDFEDDDAYYLVTEYVEGVNMADLNEDQKIVVREELRGHLATLQTLKSNRLGGPSGIVIPPYREESLFYGSSCGVSAVVIQGSSCMPLRTFGEAPAGQLRPRRCDFCVRIALTILERRSM